MACKKITKTNGSESELIATLEKIFQNEFKAEANYSYFESDAFKAEFGDYIEGYNNGDVSFNGRVDENGEPKLLYNEEAKKYYFINEKKEEVFYPLVKRGLRAVFNYNQIDKIISRLALNYFNKSKLNFNNINFEEGEPLPNLKSYIKNELITKINELKSKGLKEKMSAKLLEKSLDNLDEYVQKVDAFYKQIGIKRVDNVDESTFESENEEKRDPAFNKQSFQQDVKSSLTTNMKLRLSLLEDADNLDPIWNEPGFIGFNEAHSTLLNNITNQVAVEGEDLFELQKEIIKLLAVKKPYLKQLLKYMESFPESDKNQFAQAFNLHGNNFLVSEIQTKSKVRNQETGDLETKKGFTHTVKQISESGSKASIVTSEWGNNFKNSFLNDKNTLSKESKQILSEVIDSLNELQTKLKSDLTPVEFQQYTNDYIALTRKLGIELTENGFTNFLDEGGKIAFNSNAQIAKLSTTVVQTSIGIKKAITSFKNTSEEYKNPFDAESVFKKLAKAESFYMSEGSESSIYSSGKNQWLYSYPSYLSTRILQWQKNPELLRNWYNQSAYNKGSEIMKFLLALDLDQNKTYDDDYVNDLIKQRLNNFRLGIFNSFQDVDGDQQSATELSFKDYFTDNINKVLSNSYVRTSTPADKGSDLQIRTGYFIDSFLGAQDGVIDFTDETKEVFFNYFNSELNRMKEASSEVDALKFTPEKLTINYHYKEGSAIDAKDGNAFKSQYFPELSFSSDSSDSTVKQIKQQLYNADGTIKHTADVSANAQLKELIKDYIAGKLSEGVNQNIYNLLDQEVLEINEQGQIVNKAIDQEVFSKYVNKNLLDNEQAAVEAVSDFYINNLIQNIEYSKMFTGDVAFYKDMIDYKKRVPATYTDGLQLRLTKGEEHFTVATIDKVKVGSPHYNELVQMLGKKGAEPYGVDEKGKGNINSADGQAWITPQRWKFLTERLGKWTSDHDSLYTKMMSGENVTYTEKELKVAAQPLKGVYFYMNGKTPTYLKYSQTVLTPNMVRNAPGLRTILEQMNNQGVDELITLDGFKTGSPTPTKIHNVDNSVRKDITFNTVQLSNYGWKLQQDLPVKTFKQTDVGSQIQKNIFAGLIHNLELAGFDLDGKETNGQTISNQIVDVVSGLVDKGIKDIKEEFNVFRNGKIQNVKGFYNALVRELEKRGGSQNIIDALNKNIALYGLPQSMDKIISVFSSIMNDRLVKIKTNGGSFIQSSNFGISKEEGTGVMWHPDIENNTGAYEPREYTKENGRKGIAPAGILISGSFIAKHIADYKKYTAEELFKGKDGNPPIIDKKILQNLVGYRIPNQGLSSNDALEIIGILPEENGDTIVAYTGITTKTGSDFDIDKMYIMMPNYTLQDNRLVYTQYDSSLSNNKQSKEALQNRLIELYKSVLTHPKVIKDVMKPLDNDILKDDITDLLPAESSGVMFHFDGFNDIKLRYEFLNGKAGVGQEANAVVDVNRPGNLSINRYKIGWGNVNEKQHTKLDNEFSEELSKEDLDYYVKELIKPGADAARVKEFRQELSKIKISDSLTALLNAFVDIAKDPYITRGNWTTSTTNTGNLLIRAGVHPLYVTAFMAQPIIKEYIEYQASKESIITKNTGDIKNKFKKNLVVKNLEKLNENYPELSKPLELLYQKLINSGVSSNVFTATSSAERLQKLLGKKNVLTDQELETILTLFKNEHNRVFDAEKINITDRNLFNLKHYRDQIKNEATSSFQIAILDKFYELQEISKAVKENVDASKLDTNGMGKNVNSLFSLFNLIQHINDKEKSDKIGVLNGFQTKLDNTTLAQYYKGLKEIMRIVQANPLLFPQAQSKVQEMFNEISADLYDQPAIDEELMTALEKAYYTYTMSNFAPFNFSSVEARELLSKLPVEFNEFKKQNKGKYLIIDELQTKTDGSLKLIALNNRKKSESFEKKFTDSWRDLTIDHPEFAENLIKYSFLTSGFKMNTNQFFTYIPHEYLLQNNINKFVVDFSNQDQSDFLDKFYLNNSTNYKYVNKVFDTQVKSDNITSGFILQRDDTKESNKAKYYLSRDAGGGIYKLEGYDQFNRAIYTRVKPLGRRSANIDGKKQTLSTKGSTIVEYGEPFTEDTTNVNQEYIAKLKGLVVTERNKYNPNFILETIEDREDEATDVTVEGLRQEEKSELALKIPNIENYKVDGKIDKTLMPTPVLNKYNEIWNRYDKLITPLLQKESTNLDQQSTEITKDYNYNPSNVTEKTREEYKQYVIDKIGKPSISYETTSINFTYPDLKITISKEGGVTYNNVNQKIVDLSKTDPGYDIKFMIGLNKLAEENKPTQQSTNVEKFTYARTADNSYEVSSQGDKRFSALNAKLKDGRTIEEAYQLDVKGYRTYQIGDEVNLPSNVNFDLDEGVAQPTTAKVSNLDKTDSSLIYVEINGDEYSVPKKDIYPVKPSSQSWKDGKGKKPLHGYSEEDNYFYYKELWNQWAKENPNLLEDLRQKAEGKVLTDKFASTPVSQARALADILNETTPTQSSTSTEVATEGVAATEQVAQPVTAELTSGQYVKYNGETYIVTKQNANGTFQILNPNLEGAASKISVSKQKLQAIGREAKMVTYKGVEYLVTPNNNIISTVTNKAMNWAENDGNRRAILELANNNITAPSKIEIPTVEESLTQPMVNKPQEVSTFKPANKEQEVAIEAIRDFIENGDPKQIFTLEGKAGTGKTTLVQEALADSVAKGKRIHIAALSHKAKLVLAQKLNQRFPGKISNSSIAGLLGMKMNEETGEFEAGFSEFERPIERAEIIVIDEASMINEEALELIMAEKRYNAKVIFLGDRGQLPPIRKLSTDEISAVFQSPNKASLIERVRQGEESPILPFADNFWDNSESANPKSNPVPEGQIKDTLTNKGNLVFINSLFDVFDDVVNTFKKGIDSKNFNVIKIVTYKNATRQNYNKEIRKAIFGEDVPQFVEKDQIMFQNNYTTRDDEFSNSDEFSIETVVSSEREGYKIFELGVKTNPAINRISYIPVLAEEDRSRFNSDVSQLFDAAKRMPPGQTRKMAYQRAWALKGMFAEIDYSYAITSHKSQGSTYDNVIVDLKDIYSVGATSNASKSRSAYTGLTRAKNTAIVITSKATTNNSNVKKSLSVAPTLSEEEQQRAEELKKYCNPS